MQSSMKPLARFEQRYMISNDGYVLNLANNRKLIPVVNRNGYLKVSLATGDGGHVQALLHILVAKHFIPNPYDHPQVNHRDGVKAHCWENNLEWCDPAYNSHHALQHGLRPGYMSAGDKEAYLARVLEGEQVKDIAFAIGRRPETLHKMLRQTAKRLGIHHQWEAQMKQNRIRAALLNLETVNG